MMVTPPPTARTMVCAQIGESQQPSHGAGFQGWSNVEAEGDELAAIANIVVRLEQDQHDSSIGMGNDDTRPKMVGIVPEGQVMVDMAAHKVTGSGATMDRLKCLGDDIIELSRQLNRKMELAVLALFDKVKAGFSGTGGVARQFVGNMSKLAIDVFMDTRVYEAQMDSADTEAFHSTVVGLQEKVDTLLGQASTLEDVYKHSTLDSGHSGHHVPGDPQLCQSGIMPSLQQVQASFI